MYPLNPVNIEEQWTRFYIQPTASNFTSLHLKPRFPNNQQSFSLLWKKYYEATIM